MTTDRYELRADHTDWLDVRDPQGYRNTINQPGAVALIRQQARDIAELRTDLAAAVAERDEARTAYQVRNTEWHQNELIALALAERYKLRAEQAEARLAAIDAAPVVATVVAHADEGGMWPALDYEDENLPLIGTQLIARPAKDQP